ncbi:MAG TPA: hypothetical protein VGB68_02115 [Pyrinomonadaceae bacterium]|jgi:hypothetical protein
MSKINRKFFFEHVRNSLFGKSLTQKQVDGMTAILDEWEAKHTKKDDRWLAYMMATVYHETDQKFQGIEEYGPDSYFKKYDGRKDLGNTEPGDGLRFKGRGFVQITGRLNYTKFSKILGIDLVDNPKLALDLENCVKILFYGMTNGTFTGRKLSDYFSATAEEWVNARRIINRLDKANLIADEAKKFYAAISYTA